MRGRVAERALRVRAVAGGRGPWHRAVWRVGDWLAPRASGLTPDLGMRADGLATYADGFCRVPSTGPLELVKPSWQMRKQADYSGGRQIRL